MTTARALRPAYAATHAAAEPGAARVGFWLASVAVGMQFLISSNVLHVLGISYNVPGGNPLGKFHPSTYVAVLAGLVTMSERGGVRIGFSDLLRRSPALVFFVGTMLFCAVYSAISIGITGAADYVENYVSAAMIAFVLEVSSPQARRHLAWLMIALCCANVVVAVGETFAQTHLIPVYVGDVLLKEGAGEFRGTAGFAHPLTGAAVAMMALLSVPGLPSRPRASAFCMAVLCVGLLTFGGRTALVVGLGALLLVTTAFVLRGLAVRRLDPKLLAAVLVAAMAGPVLAYLLVTYTSIGERVVTKFYLDDSADVRAIQWLVLRQLSLRNVLFGLPEDQIPDLVFRLGLDYPISDIENPWLLTFIKLGAVGFAVYCAGLAAFIVHLWRISRLWGRVTLVCGFVVISSNNSLGTKTNILFLLTAFVVAAAGAAPEGGEHRAAEAFGAPAQPSAPPPRLAGRPAQPASGRALRPARLHPDTAVR